MDTQQSKTNTFCIVDWHSNPKADVECITVQDGKLEGPISLSGGIPRWLDAPLVCFRLKELYDKDARLKGLPDHAGAIDACLLARIVLPTEGSYDLPALAAYFSVAENAAHPVHTAAEVWIALLKKLYEQPFVILSEMSRLLEMTNHPLRGIISEAAKSAMRKSFGVRHRRIMDLFSEIGVQPGRFKRPEPSMPLVHLDVAAISGLFLADSPLAAKFNSYEYRSEQVRMVSEICGAFNDELLLLVEAGTGTGKSLAYLVPAVRWAVGNNDPVIISTNTKNLQEQLFRKDLPFLKRVLGASFRFALIKGRSNYLCVRKLLMLLANSEKELTEAERIELLPVLTWLAKTAGGDIAENTGFKSGFDSELWSRISTKAEECLGPRCRAARYCFVRKARATAMQADIVVANHATVFSEPLDQGAILPNYRCIVFDEAHNLENVLTDCGTITVTPWLVPRALVRLHKGAPDGAGQGLFSGLRFQLSRKAFIPVDLAETVGKLVAESIALFPELRHASDSFFSGVKSSLSAVRPYADRVRYSSENRPSNWPEVARDAATFSDAIGRLADVLEKIVGHVEPFGEDEAVSEALTEILDVAAEIKSQALHLRNISTILDVLMRAEDPAFVYWIDRGRGRNDTLLCAAPLDVSGLMEERVYSRARTAVFTSATLTAAGSFDFIRDRLGMRGKISERLHTSDLGSSFDFERQVMLAVPMFLPEPRADGPDFARPFSEIAASILRTTGGKGLVLFTSHAMLRETDGQIRPRLAAEGIRVLAQGVDGERSYLASLFAKETSSVLLGTQSFWEGIDVPGESLSCLILAKLPFRPHTEPIVSARCELLESQGRNAFSEYMVPDAIIRLKQGFGRLIRTRNDRGVVVICDSRVMTKSYGAAFRESLPVKAKLFHDEQTLLAAIQNFFRGASTESSECEK